MPTHRVNDTDSLQQMLLFHGLNPSSYHHHLQKQSANPSIQAPGGEESAQRRFGEKEEGLVLPMLPAHIFFGNVQSWKAQKFERRLNFVLLAKKICKGEMSHEFTIQIYSWIYNVQKRKEDCLKAESSYYTVEFWH